MALTASGYLSAMPPQVKKVVLTLIGVPFGDAAASQKSCLDFNFVQHSENPPDTGFRAVFAFGVVFVVHFAVGEWPNRLSALKIESYRHRHSTVLWPEYFSLSVIFSDHHAISLF